MAPTQPIAARRAGRASGPPAGEPRAHRRRGDRAGPQALLRRAERRRGHARGAASGARSSTATSTTSATCSLRASREAIEELYEAQRGARPRRGPATPTRCGARFEAAVDVYQRHGPLLRGVAEAAAGDEQIARDYARAARRFDDLPSSRCAAWPASAHALADLAETARALNLMNETYLLDAFGREPRVSPETAVQTLTEIWDAVDPPLTKGPDRWTSSAPPTSASRTCPGYPTSRTTPRSTACACTTSTRAAARPCSASTASRAGATSTGTCSTALVAAGHRVVCPDLVGFGRSDKPTDQDWYTYDRHVDTVTRAPRPARPRGRDRGGAGLGRPDRAALGGRARRPGGAARDPQHRPVHRPGEQGLHGLARLRRAHAGPADRHDHPGRDHDRPAARRSSPPTRRRSPPRRARRARSASRCSCR